MTNETSYKAIAVPTRVLLHPNDPLRIGGDMLRLAADSATGMRRNATQGQAWRDAVDVSAVKDEADLRVDSYIATTEGSSAALAMREDGVMLLTEIDDATGGFLCHLAKTLDTTFSMAPIPAGTASAPLLRAQRAEVITKMKKGPFLDGYYWTNIARVNEGPDVVKRYKIKTGEIAPDADKKADAKAKKAAATKAAAGGEAAAE